MKKHFLFVLLCVPALQAALVQPDSATASSEFSSSYVIGNAIDGSGLPAGFTPSDAHATYTTNNHWTSARNALSAGPVSASFFFDTALTLDAFYLWNHRSNGVAANDLYEVTKFNLILKDAGGSALLTLNDLVAAGETATAQTYLFGPVASVKQVDFVITSNQGLEQGIGTNYTGVAEVAFNQTTVSPVPEPSSILYLTGGLSLAGVLRFLKRVRTA